MAKAILIPRSEAIDIPKNNSKDPAWLARTFDEFDKGIFAGSQGEIQDSWFSYQLAKHGIPSFYKLLNFYNCEEKTADPAVSQKAAEDLLTGKPSLEGLDFFD